MIHTARLLEEHTTEIDVSPESHEYLIEHGYPVDVQKKWSVVNHKPNAENSGYIVQEVLTLAKPKPQADIVADEMTVLTCTCAGYRYHDGIPDLEEHSITEWEPCKHCEAVEKSLKAKNDNQQETLDP